MEGTTDESACVPTVVAIVCEQRESLEPFNRHIIICDRLHTEYANRKEMKRSITGDSSSTASRTSVRVFASNVVLEVQSDGDAELRWGRISDGTFLSIYCLWFLVFINMFKTCKC